MGGFHGGHGSSSSGFHGGGHHISSSSSHSGSSGGSSIGDDFAEGVIGGIFAVGFFAIVFAALKLHYKIKIVISVIATILLVFTLGFGCCFSTNARVTNVNATETITSETNSIQTIRYNENVTYEYTYFWQKYTYKKTFTTNYKQHKTAVGVITEKTIEKTKIGDTDKIYIQLFNPSIQKDDCSIGSIILAVFLGMTILVFSMSSIYDISQEKRIKQLMKGIKIRNTFIINYKLRFVIATLSAIGLILTLGFGLGFGTGGTITDISSKRGADIVYYEYSYFGNTYESSLIQENCTKEIGDINRIYVQLFNPNEIKSNFDYPYLFLIAFLLLLSIIFYASVIYELRITARVTKGKNPYYKKWQAELDSKDKCPNCGTTINPKDSFCPICEYNLKE